jgi:DNA-binding MarR family transcriptional regulator/N-acetylglutamate synthase-like GNAT family acetyltransferase
MVCSDPSRAAEAVRHFNRFYARHAGALHERLHKSDFSLTEVRILHELAHDRATTAADLSRNLGLDTGYLSRLITNFQKLGLVVKSRNEADGRAHLLTVTDEARAAVDEIDLHISAETTSLLSRLYPGEIEQLVMAMADIERLLSPESRGAIETRLRSPHVGDFGWMIERHAHLVPPQRSSTGGEAYAAAAVAQFMKAMQSNTQRIACWVAEQSGAARIGAAVLMAETETLARIELLFVEPSARRRGLGAQLVAACTNFAHGAGYDNVVCRLSEAHVDLCGLFMHAGFKPVQEEKQGIMFRRELRKVYAD